MIRLSIIIPFYNVEKYIAQCLDSVVNQDIPLSDYEIICVNDASPDGSRDIVLDYMKRYSNIRLIEHEYNKKLGAARNTGRSIARGKYVWNVDSDDMVAPNCLKEVLDICESKNLDVLEMCYANMRGDDVSDSTSFYQTKRDDNIYTGPQYLEKYHLNYLGGICSIWRKIYKRDFLDSNEILSPPINMGEDEPFAIKVFALARRISYYDRDCYYYRRTEQSLSGEKRSRWSAQKWYEASITCARYMDKVFSEIGNNYSAFSREKIKQMVSYDAQYWKIFDIPPKEKKQFWGMCRKDLWTNLFIFKYLTRKSRFDYIKNLCLVGWRH